MVKVVKWQTLRNISIGATPDLRIALPEEATSKSLQKCEQIKESNASPCY